MFCSPGLFSLCNVFVKKTPPPKKNNNDDEGYTLCNKLHWKVSMIFFTIMNKQLCLLRHNFKVPHQILTLQSKCHLLILDNQSFIAINVRTRVQELKINPERETILNSLLIMVVCYKQTNIVFRRQISSCCIYEFFRLWPEVTDVEALREIRQRVKLMKLIIPLWHSQLCLIVDTKCDFRNWNITFSNLWTILKHVWSQEMWK